MAVAQFRVVPSRKTVAEMSDEDSAVICAQALLLNKVRPDSSTEEMYEQFTTTAVSAPFLVLDRTRTVKENRSASTERSENIKMETITEVLELLLPSTLHQMVKAAILPAILKSIQGDLEVDKRISCPRDRNGDQEIGFLLLQTPGWGERCFSIYFCKVKTSVTIQNKTYMWIRQKHENVFSVAGECLHSQYTVIPSMLATLMQRDGNAKKDIDEFLKHTEDARSIQQALRDTEVRRLQKTASSDLTRSGLAVTRGQEHDSPLPKQLQSHQLSENVNLQGEDQNLQELPTSEQTQK